MKVLYVGRKLDTNPKFGGALINRRNKNFLTEIYGPENVDFFYPEKESRALRALSAHAPFPMGTHKRFLRTLQQTPYDIVFLSGAEFGSLFRMLRFIKRKTHTVTFCHNCEKDFAKAYLKAEPGPGRLLFYWEHSREERLAIRYSDLLLGMLQRDNSAIKHYYNRTFDAIIPSSLPDFYKAAPPAARLTAVPASMLFIGSDLPFNRHGLEWFVREVLPHVNIKVIAIGNNTEKWRATLQHERLEILGTVDSPAAYYNTADAVISPIFLGSGMKTKTVETFMFGKPYFATPESLEGFNVNNQKGVWVCADSRSFIEAINAFLSDKKRRSYYDNLRQLYLDCYSDKAVKKVFADVLKKQN
jgi:hypothetical protein